MEINEIDILINPQIPKAVDNQQIAVYINKEVLGKYITGMTYTAPTHTLTITYADSTTLSVVLAQNLSEFTNDSNFITNVVNDLVNYYTKTESNNLLDNKVDKVTGKGLSSNDYTTAEKNKVAEIDNKVDKVPGKSLSTNDYTNSDKDKVEGLESTYYSKTQIDALIAAINKLEFVPVTTLPTASASTMNKIYLVPAALTTITNLKDEYVTIRSGEEGSYTYTWEQIGSTAVDLSTKEDLFRYAVMPTPSATYLNKLVQYIGNTDSTYTYGYFYTCKQDPNDGTYNWAVTNVQDTNIVNGIGLYSATVKEEPNRQNEMYGRAGLGAGHKNTYYQLDGIIGGNGNQHGMSEIEFDNYWWDSINNVAKNGGKGKDSDGNILDAFGSKYSRSYINGYTGGENSKTLFRDSINVGYGCLAKNIKTQTFGHKTKASKENMFAAGQYNEDNSSDDNIFEVGCGWAYAKSSFSEATDLIAYIYEDSNREDVLITSENASSVWANSSITSVYKRDNALSINRNGYVSVKYGLHLKGKEVNFTSHKDINTMPLRDGQGLFKTGHIGYVVDGGVYSLTTPAKTITDLNVGQTHIYDLGFSCTINGTKTKFKGIYFRAVDSDGYITEIDYIKTDGTGVAAVRNKYLSHSGYGTLTITSVPDITNNGIETFLMWLETYTTTTSLPDDDKYTVANKEYVNNNKGTEVSGVNDGTNWTSLTVNGITKSIPAGGGSYSGRKYLHTITASFTEYSGGGSIKLQCITDSATPITKNTWSSNYNNMYIIGEGHISFSPRPEINVRYVIMRPTSDPDEWWVYQRINLSDWTFFLNVANSNISDTVTTLIAQ